MLLSKELINFGKLEKMYLENGWSKDVIECTSTYKIEYLSDDVIVEGYISEPENIKGKTPVIIWNRGGFGEDGRLDEFLAAGILGEIASWGYIAMMSNYRDDDELGGKDLNDILNLIEIAEDMPACDADRIGMEGWSRGGMMLYLTLTKTDKIKCAVSVAGMANLRRNRDSNSKLSELIEAKLGGLKEADDDIIDSRTALKFYDKMNSVTPILFLHGTNDEKISYKDSEELYNLLKERNKKTNYEFRLFEGDDHYLNKHKQEVSRIKKEWFDRYLKS
jgi:dipeptidyl aminopeptidase/acylaminoacyl peptidase